MIVAGIGRGESTTDLRREGTQAQARVVPCCALRLQRPFRGLTDTAHGLRHTPSALRESVSFAATPRWCRPTSASFAHCREPCALRPSTDSESQRRHGRLAGSQGVSAVHHPNEDLDTGHHEPSRCNGRPEAGDDRHRRGRSDHPWHEPVHDEPARSPHPPRAGRDPGRSSSRPRNLYARDPPPDRRTVPPRRCR